jgi:hypothetical protein
MRTEHEVKLALKAAVDLNPKTAFQETIQTITVAVLEWVLGERKEIEI